MNIPTKSTLEITSTPVEFEFHTPSHDTAFLELPQSHAGTRIRITRAPFYIRLLQGRYGTLTGQYEQEEDRWEARFEDDTIVTAHRYNEEEGRLETRTQNGVIHVWVPSTSFDMPRDLGPQR